MFFVFILLINCSSSSEEPLRTGNSITFFQLPINNELIAGQINQSSNTIVFNVTDANLASLTPTITISEGATISPSINSPRNFNQEVRYTVTAENGMENEYVVIVNNTIRSNENFITLFKLNVNGESIETRIDQDLREIAFETGSFDISALVPEITVSENATITPASGETVDFSVPVTYTVTAENGTSVQYTIVINQAFNINAFTLVGPRFGSQLLFIRAEMFINLEFLNPSTQGAELFLDDGVNKIDLPIIKTESFENQRIITYQVTTKIPENTVTSSNYKIVYKTADVSIESDFFIDVLAEDAPRIISVNQDSYKEGDTFIVTGENLTDFIGVPSNGSFFLFNPFGNIDVELNLERTEYRLLMEGGFVRSAFFPFDAVTRDVIFMTSEFRLGDQITVNID